MNNYLLIIIGIVIVIIAAVIFSWFKKRKDNSKKELKLTYKMSAGIPFKRIYEIGNENIVECIKCFISKNENTRGKVGAPIYTTYVFKGLKEGNTMITFKVVSIVNNNEVMSEDVINVIVDKDKNIMRKGNNNE